MSPRVYSYIRVSSAAQVDRDGLRRQTDEAKKYAETVGLPLDTELELVDRGVSAWTGDNWSGAFGLFLDAIKRKEVPRDSILFVESLDRLSRQAPKKVFPLFNGILNEGVHIYADHRLFRHDSEENYIVDVLSAIISMQRAYEESQRKSERVSASKAKRRQNTIDTGEAFSENHVNWVRLDGKRYVEVPEKSALVRRIFTEYADGGFGADLIARRLNREGVPVLGTATRWHVTSVTKLLTNRAVLGEFNPGLGSKKRHRKTDIIVRGYYPQIIDQSLWDRAQQARTVRSTKFKGRGAGRKGATVGNLFGGDMLRCGHCGGLFKYYNHGVRRRVRKDGTIWISEASIVLRCLNAEQLDNCNGASWKYGDFEASFLQFVKEMQVAALQIQDDGTAAKLDAESRSCEGRLIDLTRKRDNLLDLMEDAPSKALKDRYKASELAVSECEKDLNRLRGQQSDHAAQLASFAAGASGIQALLSLAQDPEARLRLQHHLKGIVERILVFPGAPNIDDEDEPMTFDVSRRFFVVKFRDGTSTIVRDGKNKDSLVSHGEFGMVFDG